MNEETSWKMRDIFRDNVEFFANDYGLSFRIYPKEGCKPIAAFDPDGAKLLRDKLIESFPLEEAAPVSKGFYLMRHPHGKPHKAKVCFNPSIRLSADKYGKFFPNRKDVDCHRQRLIEQHGEEYVYFVVEVPA